MKPRIKKSLKIAALIYAVICSIIVTSVLLIILWNILFPLKVEELSISNPVLVNFKMPVYDRSTGKLTKIIRAQKAMSINDKQVFFIECIN